LLPGKPMMTTSTGPETTVTLLLDFSCLGWTLSRACMSIMAHGSVSYARAAEPAARVLSGEVRDRSCGMSAMGQG